VKSLLESATIDATVGASASSASCRYAVYLIPSGPWSQLGQRWLGRDAGTGERIARPVDEDASFIDAWTEAPRLYGLHATLKPPFRMAPGHTFSDLDEALRQLASLQLPFEIPLALTRLRGFLAWCVAGTTEGVQDSRTTGMTTRMTTRASDAAMPAALEALANACVADLDGFRAVPTAAETARRLDDRLSPPQAANLQRWGYPYVFDTFVFHITLTGRLDEIGIGAAELALRRLARADEALALQPGAVMSVNDIGLFVQAAPGLPFVIARRYGFDGTMRGGRP